MTVPKSLPLPSLRSSLRVRMLLQPLLMAAVWLFACLASSHAVAQTAPVDPPSRVGRMAELQGQVWFYGPESAEWTTAVRNRPLTTGDRIATDPGAHAEVQVGSSILRLDENSELEVVVLDDDQLLVQLHSGSVSARVRDVAEAGRFDIETEDGRFLVQRSGRYRVDRGVRSSFITVISGQAYYEGRGSGVVIQPGQRAEFFIDASNVAQYGVTAPANDSFALWNSERDRLADRSVQAAYVSPEMTGAGELDRYGRWEQSAEYGALWIPRNVATDWAPYTTGHWAWVQPWGWTWVDDAPWGFAPFHYGRWVNVRNTWCWTPGARVLRPVYAPALVGWIGGPNLSVSISIGGGRRSPGPAVGWFPLAPREVYVPSYRTSPRYAQNINITHVTNITNITTVINNPQAPREFRNRHFQNAVTVVPTTVFVGRQPVAGAAAQWRQSPGAREVVRQAGPTPVLVSPPVAAPAPVARSSPQPVRRDDPRTGRPAFGERGRDAIEPAPQRDAPRDPSRDPSRDLPRRDAVRPAPAPAAPAPAAAPAPVVVAPAAPRAEPEAPGRRPGNPRIDERRGDGVAPSERVAPPVVRPPMAPSRDPRAADDRTAAPVPAREAPTVRPQPVRRAEERPPVSVAPVAPVAPAAAVRPVEASRPAEAARPVEAAPRSRPEPARDPREERRDDKKDERRGDRER